jgi:hypothetical protein
VLNSFLLYELIFTFQTVAIKINLRYNENMWSKVSRLGAIFCILVYVGAAGLAAWKIYTGVGEQRRRAIEEFTELSIYAAGQGSAFLTEAYKDDIRDSVRYSQALQAVIISTPDGRDFAAEKEKGNAILMFGDSPRFNDFFFLYGKPLFTPLNIAGERNITLSAISPYLNPAELLKILRTSLFAVLIATLAAFTLLILDLAVFNKKTSGENEEIEDNNESFDDIDAKDSAISDDSLLKADTDTTDSDSLPDDNFDFPDFSADSENGENTAAKESADSSFDMDLPDSGDDDDFTGGFAEKAETDSGDADFDLNAGGDVPPAFDEDDDDKEDLSENKNKPLDEFAEEGETAGEAADLDSAPPIDDFDLGLDGLDLSSASLDNEGDAADDKASAEEDALQEKIEETLRQGILMGQETVLVSIVYDPPGGTKSLMSSMTSINEVYENLFTLAARFWKRDDMVFRSRHEGLFVVVANVEIDEVFAEAKDFYKEAMDDFASDDGGNLRLGLSGAQGRKDIDAGRLLIEAEGASKRAENTPADPIVEFKPDIEKWEQLAAERAEAGGDVSG